MKPIDLRPSVLSTYLAIQVDEELPLTTEKDLLDLLRSRSAASGLQMRSKTKEPGTVVELVLMVRNRTNGRVVLMRTPPGDSPESDTAEIMNYLCSEGVVITPMLHD